MQVSDSVTRVPEANIGLVGHVDHGKTTLTKALSGEWTDTHSEEIRRGITIRIGYADFTTYTCPNDHLTVKEECSTCGEPATLTRALSLVDAPGHETLMANVLSGAAIMDGALLIIAADEDCPQPQTREHLEVLNISGMENIIIVQNKIDAVSREQAQEHHQQIKAFVEGTVAEDAPIIPVSALYEANIDALAQAIEDHIPTPDRDENAAPRMLVARSFDINRPGNPIQELHGGIVGGSLVQGVLEAGDEIELRPGAQVNGKWTPIQTQVTSIRHGSAVVEKGRPGGLLGVETGLDPALAKSDGLAGNVLGRTGELPPVREHLALDIHLLDRAAHLEDADTVQNIRKNEPLLVIVGAMKTAGVVTQAGKPVNVKLKIPVAAETGEKAAIARNVKGRWRLIGYGIIQDTE